MIKKWEYRRFWIEKNTAADVEMPKQLNELGAEGWELVADNGYWYTVKRLAEIRTAR